MKHLKVKRNRLGQFLKGKEHPRWERGKITIQTIQLVYEDNIKQFGTLTCYLCEKPIRFGKDHLEHRVPVSRNGTNDYNNLAIACQSCNCSKGTRTEEEYRKLKVGEIKNERK